MNHRRANARKRMSQLLFLLTGMTLMLNQVTVAAPKRIDATTFSNLLRKAQAGSLTDQVAVADAYASGVNGSPSMEAAAQWYRKAADAGEPCAQTSLGVLYLQGLGVTKDASQAARWFQRAAASNFPLAQHNLAVLYLNGAGVKRDPQRAMELFARAANAGLDIAKTDLGLE